MSDFVSVEDAIGPWLNTRLGVRVVTETPSDITGSLVQLVRVGGPDDDYGLDVATVHVNAFALTRAAANTLAEQVRTALREALPGTRLPGLVVSRVQTISGPAWLPYVDTNVRVFRAAYQLTLHRQ